MACGLPVIAFDQYGPEAVVDGSTGFVVNSEFVMLEKLKILLHTPGLIEKFSKNARTRASNYSGTQLKGKLEDIIDEM